ncbi:hypothetical protein FRC00_014589 [Tulasnella sp. 408]|nr:hypothetical protein FRC00_014589 [Tulasnella sp. 408]
MPDLSSNPLDETNALLRLIVMKADNNTLTPADLSLSFSPNSTSVVVNCLLYASLSCSLLAAVGAMMSKEWLQSFDRTGQTGPLEEQGRFRQRKFNGVERWHLEAIIKFLPNLLLSSVILFFAGIGLYLVPINTAVAVIVIAFSGLGVTLSGVAIVAGAVSPLCPYQSAASSALRRIAVTFVDSQRRLSRSKLYLATEDVLMDVMYSVKRAFRRGAKLLEAPFSMIRRRNRTSSARFTRNRRWLYRPPSSQRKKSVEYGEQVVTAQAACWLLGTTSNRGDQIAASRFILAFDRDVCVLAFADSTTWQQLVSLARETFDIWYSQPNERNQEVAQLFGLALCHASLPHSENDGGENDLADLRLNRPNWRSFGDTFLRALGLAWTKYSSHNPTDEEYIFYVAILSTMISGHSGIRVYQWGNSSRLLLAGKTHGVADILLSLWAMAINHIGVEGDKFPHDYALEWLLEFGNNKEWLARTLSNAIRYSGGLLCTIEGPIAEGPHLVEGYTAFIRRARELSPLTSRQHLHQTAFGVAQLIRMFIDPLTTSGVGETKPEVVMLAVEAVLGLRTFTGDHPEPDEPDEPDEPQEPEGSHPAQIVHDRLIDAVADMLDDSDTQASTLWWMRQTRPCLIRVLLWLWKNMPEIQMKEKEQKKIFNTSCRLWAPLEKEVYLSKSGKFEEHERPLRSDDMDKVHEFIQDIRNAGRNSDFISRNADVGINRLYDHFNRRAEWDYQLFGIGLDEQLKPCSRSTYIRNGML